MKRSWLAILVLLAFVLFVKTAAWAATQTVTNTADSGSGSLRQAIANASAGDTINFNLAYPAVITLASALALTKTLTITGPSANSLTVSGNHTVNIFNIGGTGTVCALSGLTVAQGCQSSAYAVGGAFYISSGTVNLDSCVIKGNVAESGGTNVWGGAIFAQNATLGMNRCTMEGNSTLAVSGYAGRGGAIYCQQSTLNIYNSTFTNNLSTWGSAVYTQDSKTTLSNVTITGNHSASNGALLFTGDAAFGPNSLANCTVSGNVSDLSVAGIQVETDVLSLRNTVMAGNLTASYGEVDLAVIPVVAGATVTSYGYNFIGATPGSSFVWTTGDTMGTHSSPLDPQLAALTDNGGYVQTQPLIAGSLAIDPADGNGAPFVDARGYLRSNTADKGAYEYQGTLPVATAATQPGLAGLTANWNAVIGAASYNLDVATDVGFTSWVNGYNNLSVGNVTTYAVAGLSPGTTYYYRVRAVNGNYMSWYSNAMTGTTLAPSATSTTTITRTPTASLTATPTVTLMATISPTQTVSATRTASASVTPTRTVTPTSTATTLPSATRTVTLLPQDAGVDLRGKAFLAYPNPAKTRVNFALRGDASGEAKVTVFNFRGERVATLTGLVSQGSIANLVWDCGTVAPGMYLARWEQDGKEIGKTKLAMVK
jgi:hypothetical protein